MSCPQTVFFGYFAFVVVVCLFVLFSFVVLSTNLASGRELERKERISHPHPHPFSLAVNNILFSYALSLRKLDQGKTDFHFPRTTRLNLTKRNDGLWGREWL